MSSQQLLQRTAFRTSRLLDFCSERELVAQTGHSRDAWPLVVLKELLDNALDACEDAGIAPKIRATVDSHGITVTDNGPGLSTDTVAGVLDFSIRVSSREAYVSPTRGAQGNALKTLVAMPFVLDGEEGRMDIISQGSHHQIAMRVDRIRQQPVIDHQVLAEQLVRNGTSVTVHWPDSASSILDRVRARFLQIAADYTFLNPHLDLTVDWHGQAAAFPATDPTWLKWLPCQPTSAHWYRPEHFERLVAAYIAHDADRGRDRTVRELVAEFHGLAGTAKQKAILEVTGLGRTNLSALSDDHGVRSQAAAQLLAAMQRLTKPIKPDALGVIGKDHLAQRFQSLGCEIDSFAYRKVTGTWDGIPWMAETAFAWLPDGPRRLITGVNWSPGILNPFRQLGRDGQSLDSVLEKQWAGREEPVVVFLHLACPRVAFTDRGKGALILSSNEE